MRSTKCNGWSSLDSPTPSGTSASDMNGHPSIVNVTSSFGSGPGVVLPDESSSLSNVNMVRCDKQPPLRVGSIDPVNPCLIYFDVL